MPSTAELDAPRRRRLLQLAREAIRHGLEQGQPLPVPEETDGVLRRPGACFVTLTLNGQLRGCIGTLEERDPLVAAVVHYAHCAAFTDIRFPPLSSAELDRVRIEVSVLSPMEPLTVTSEAELLALLRPGVDGLWLDAGHHRATFLPQVWEKLPDPVQFLRQLRLKAGLAPDYWSETTYWYRYTVISFQEAAADAPAAD